MHQIGMNVSITCKSLEVTCQVTSTLRSHGSDRVLFQIVHRTLWSFALLQRKKGNNHGQFNEFDVFYRSISSRYFGKVFAEYLHPSVTTPV